MQVCLLIDRPGHPVLSAVLSTLAEHHETRVVEVPRLDDAAISRELDAPADVYLLKSRSVAALELGRALEDRGATVLNTTASTSACLDRVLLTEGLAQAGLDTPRTEVFPSVRELRESLDSQAVTFPSMVKSRHSRRGDLVQRLDRADEVLALGAEWDEEPVVLQEFVAGDGWDVKVWVIGEAVYSAKRRSALITGAVGDAKRNVTMGDLPDEWHGIALRAGRAFGLELYGLDLLPSDRGALVVDVNAFPGFRSVPDAPEALAELIERRATAAVGGP